MNMKLGAKNLPTQKKKLGKENCELDKGTEKKTFQAEERQKKKIDGKNRYQISNKRNKPRVVMR